MVPNVWPTYWSIRRSILSFNNSHKFLGKLLNRKRVPRRHHYGSSIRGRSNSPRLWNAQHSVDVNDLTMSIWANALLPDSLPVTALPRAHTRRKTRVLTVIAMKPCNLSVLNHREIYLLVPINTESHRLATTSRSILYCHRAQPECAWPIGQSPSSTDGSLVPD